MADPVRIYTLTETTFDSDLRLPVDKSSFANTKQISWSTLTYDDAVESDQSGNFFHVITPGSLLKTTASTSRKGIIETSTDTEAEDATSTSKSLTPSNINPIVSSIMGNVTSYSTSSIISSITGATIAGGLVARWREINIGGGQVIGHCAFTLNVTDTPEIVITANTNADNLPDQIQAGSFMHYEASTGKNSAFASGGCTVGVNSSKLEMKLTRGFAPWDDAQNPIYCTINYQIFV